ncbi:MAG: hypothetical protein LR015_04020 [Verrucomicrobia bacterium]|nr:hypothetical protein [Verrucomicrobiota bacterium]
MVNSSNGNPHQVAWQALTSYLIRPGKLEDVMAHLGEENRAQSQQLIMCVFKDYLFIEHALTPFLQRTPRPKLRALLMLAVGEALDVESDRQARIQHWAVECAKSSLSKAESGLVNAVLRKVWGHLDVILAERNELNHPRWLLNRWQQAWGSEATAQFCVWNQMPAPTFIRCTAEDAPAGAVPTQWPGFYHLQGVAAEEWLPIVRSGAGYIQDPMTRRPVELLDIQSGDRVLDVCAAPGGKSCWFRQKLSDDGLLVAVDAPGARLDRLHENLMRYGSAPVLVIGKHLPVSESDWNSSLPENARKFNKVLVDVPCSNTGVLRRKPDVRLRLQPSDLDALPKLQLSLLRWAAAKVIPGGLLAYSTCSVEDVENKKVIDEFLSHSEDFSLLHGEVSLPWLTHHDGGGVFILQRV